MNFVRIFAFSKSTDCLEEEQDEELRLKDYSDIDSYSDSDDIIDSTKDWVLEIAKLPCFLWDLTVKFIELTPEVRCEEATLF